MHSFDTLAKTLAPHYSRFKVEERLLFSSHSHQAWPNCAELGLSDAFNDAAIHIDDKWQSAFAKTDVLRNYLRDWYEDPTGQYCLGPNTHQLLVSWLSSLPLKRKTRLVTTDGEFHSLYRQLHRLEAEGLEVIYVQAAPQETFAQRVIDQLDHNTAGVALSRVFFETSLINKHLSTIAAAAREKNIPVLIDDYHGTHVSPLSLKDSQLEDCFLVTGGYKYLQWGEGNCFLRFPKNCQLQPIITGWFASFSSLEKGRDTAPTQYDNGDQRFAGATYDPVSQYRAARVIEFFQSQKLDKPTLTENYQQQIQYLHQAISALNISPGVLDFAHHQTLDNNAGFLSLRTRHAETLQKNLLAEGVMTDSRGDILRFGPAPFIRASQIDSAVEALDRCLRALR